MTAAPAMGHEQSVVRHCLGDGVSLIADIRLPAFELLFKAGCGTPIPRSNGVSGPIAVVTAECKNTLQRGARS